jgi:hypothetical protein
MAIKNFFLSVALLLCSSLYAANVSTPGGNGSNMTFTGNSTIPFAYVLSSTGFAAQVAVTPGKIGKAFNADRATNWLGSTPFTIILVPDSQGFANVTYSNNWYKSCQWIKGQVVSLNIKAVLGLGDITDDGAASSFTIMRSGLDTLTNTVPFLPCVGNHDGYSAYANFNSVFTPNWLTNQVGWHGGFMTNGSAQNAYLVFTNAGISYVCTTVEWPCGLAGDRLMWASNVFSLFSQNSYGILTTHAFLQPSGYRDQLGDLYDGPTTYGVGLTGEQMWSYAKQWPSLGMIANGHFLLTSDQQMTFESRRLDTGVTGNWVNSVFCNHQQDMPNSCLKILTFYPGQGFITASTIAITTTSTNYENYDYYTMPMLSSGVIQDDLNAGQGLEIVTNKGTAKTVEINSNSALFASGTLNNDTTRSGLTLWVPLNEGTGVLSIIPGQIT